MSANDLTWPDAVRALGRENREIRKHLRVLTQAVDYFLFRLDAEMKGPSSEERGKRIAAFANGLDMQNQIAKRFGLPSSHPRTRSRARAK
jgi:hypothetical protein